MSKEKRLLITRADDNITEMTDLTHPIIKHFAEEWGADFKVLDHVSECTVGDGITHYRIMDLYELLDEYDRILQLDSDIVINKTCPNLFDIVPEDCIGTIYEDVGSRAVYRRNTIKEAQMQWEYIGWKEGYINTGVFMVSKCHKPIFQKVNGEYWTGFGFDDVLLGYQIVKQGMKVHELPFQYNHMTMFSEPWNGSANKFDSHIIHYAGRNFTPAQIMEDIKYIYGTHKPW